MTNPTETIDLDIKERNEALNVCAQHSCCKMNNTALLLPCLYYAM